MARRYADSPSTFNAISDYYATKNDRVAPVDGYYAAAWMLILISGKVGAQTINDIEADEAVKTITNYRIGLTRLERKHSGHHSGR